MNVNINRARTGPNRVSCFFHFPVKAAMILSARPGLTMIPVGEPWKYDYSIRSSKFILQ